MKKITLLILLFFGSITLSAQRSEATDKDDSVIISRSADENKIEGFEHFYDISADKLIISAKESFSKINLFNILGQRLISKKLSSKKEKIDLTSLKTGIYLANVEVKGKVTSFKVVKR